MRQIVFFAISSIFFVGCGGGSDSSSNPVSSDVVMLSSELYSVYPGDKVIRTSDDTLLKIIHTDAQESSTVTLVEGNATIIRKP